MKKNCLQVFALMLLMFGCKYAAMAQTAPLNVKAQLAYCLAQVKKSLQASKDGDINIPRSIPAGKTDWKYVGYKDWTSGFWPGVLWYAYEYSKDKSLKIAADKFSRELAPLAYSPAYDHDLGFQVYCSFGNGYRLTKDKAYKKIILATADTLATLFNPKVGTILSWPREVKNFGAHNTIMDNMMNLELLFWASKNGGSKKLYNIAVSHAKKTMANHFRKDYSGYHVVLYDTITGKKIKGITHQGYSDSSMWARGQSWAIYGFTMCYRETKNPAYLGFAQKVANIYLKRLPKDLIPYWDFDDAAIPNTPKDVSAAAVTASALIELSTFIKDAKLSAYYLGKAKAMLTEISTEKYQSHEVNNAILLHSTGHKPNNSEVDASIIYADYYYMEALLRLRAKDNF
ncbi:glycoside hydrolase family 88 protein [Parasediminibacterium sp. JCM 36343]|uniref:glycoside hydrolase family 88 protein n=1 Tax=Parasediminibacterium sp. JCM 36343 TaxID=3374279 RepID=UPI003979CD64